MNAITKTKPEVKNKGKATELRTPVLASSHDAQLSRVSSFGRASAPREPRSVQEMSVYTALEMTDETQKSGALADATSDASASSDNWRHNVHRLHVDKCRIWEYNPRHSISEEEILQLAELIKMQGQIDPILVILSDDGSGLYDILCGQRRWLAIKESQFEGGLISAFIAPQSLNFQERMDLAVKTQKNTKELYDIDYALTVIRLDARGEGSAAIAMGIHKSVASKLRALGSLPDKILIKMKENPSKFKANMGYELQKYLQATNELTTYDFVEQIVDEDLSLDDVRRCIGLLTGEIVKKTRKSWTADALTRDGVQLGMIKERATTNELTIELKGISTEGADKVKEFISSMIKDQKYMDVEVAKRVASEAKAESAKTKLPTPTSNE